MGENFNFPPDPKPVAPTYMGLVEAIQMCLSKYANFTGRASRSEYWWFFLFVVIVEIMCNILGLFGTIGKVFGYLIDLAFVVPMLAVSWRRMHDIGKGGGWWFINLIPLVGWIIWIVFCCKPSEPFANRFGDVPADVQNS